MLAPLLSLDPLAFVAVLAVLGLMVGSFLNVVIHRLPLMMEREWRSECEQLLGTATDGQAPAPFDLARPRSRCPHCGVQINALENIPLVSYVALRGRCRHCHAAISSRYPLIEAAAGLAGGYSAWHFAAAGGALAVPQVWTALAAAVFVWMLLALAVIDLDTKLLPDSITLPLLWLGIAASLLELMGPDLETAVLGAMLGYASLWSIYWLFKLVTGKEGMGYGDFKLLAALGAWLGWDALPAVILLSSAVGAITGLVMIASGLVKRAEPIPFGPYLAAAGIIALYWAEPLASFFGRSTGL